MKLGSLLSGGALLVFCLTGCVTCEGENEPCLESVIPVESLENLYGCTDTRRQLHIDLPQTYTRISTQAEFDQRVSGTCHPQIDFATYDLIIGRSVVHSGGATATYIYRRLCNPGRLELRVVFTGGITNDAPTLTYHALVPKLGHTETLRVEVEHK